MKKNFALGLAQLLMALGFILGFQPSALASVSGDWKGQGSWTYEGTGDHCQVQMSFQQTAQNLTRQKSSFNCDIVKMDSPAITWDLQGQNMLLNGVVVGQIVGDSFTVTEKYSPTISIKMTLKAQGLHADYSEVWSDDKGQVIYNIQATLSRP